MDRGDLLLGDLRDVQEALDELVELHDGAEVEQLVDRALVHRAARELAVDAHPRVVRQLLDAKREALTLGLDGQDLRLDLLTLLEVVGRVAHLVRPGQVRDVAEAVDITADVDEDAEVGDVADLTLDLRADRVLLREDVPRVALELLHAQRDALALEIDLEDDRLNLVADAHHLRGVLDALGPAHLRDVDHALDALLELDEAAVVRHGDDGTADALTDVVTLVHGLPRILGDLLEAEADPLALGVVAQHLDAHVVADVEHLLGVLVARPAHVADVQQAVDAAQIDERAVVRDVLDDAVDEHARLELAERLALERLALLLEQGAAAEHDVAALLVELDDLEVEALADELLEVAHGAQVDLRRGQERLDADVDGQAALDPPGDDTLDELLVLTGLGDLIPDLQAVSLLLADLDEPVVVLCALDVDLDDVAGLDRDAALGVVELAGADAALGLVADVDDRKLLADREDRALDDLAFDAAELGLFLLKQGDECLLVLDHLWGASVLNLGHGMVFRMSPGRRRVCAVGRNEGFTGEPVALPRRPRWGPFGTRSTDVGGKGREKCP